MNRIIQIRVGENRAVQSFGLGDIECNRGDCVILQVDRGLDHGVVVSDVHGECKQKEESLSGSVIRVANAEDLEKIESNKKKATEALNVCLRKINERKLRMKIVKAEYTYDTSKIVFFFTAEGRIDFRALVKDLARIFKVRIELKQIGVRDKAKITGGFGVCGRSLCCSSYMKGFHPLTIKIPKEQGLPLNPSRISGMCGRIKCCMAYEFQVYKEFSRSLPRVGEKVTTPQGQGKIFEVNILKRYVRVDLGDGKITRVIFSKENEE